EDERRDPGQDHAGSGGNEGQRPGLAQIELHPDRRGDNRERAEQLKPLPHLWVYFGVAGAFSAGFFRRSQTHAAAATTKRTRAVYWESRRAAPPKVWQSGSSRKNSMTNR